MSPYTWTESSYLCPECSSRLESKAGPDGLKAERCPNCEWSKVYDPAADEFRMDELERVRPVTDGGRPDADIQQPTRDTTRTCQWCGVEKERTEITPYYVHEGESVDVKHLCDSCGEDTIAGV